MAMQVKDVREWLETLGDEEYIAIDDGGLALTTEDKACYLEIGCISEEG